MTPCVRCGKCCYDEVCPVGEEIYGTDKAPCPVLKWDGNIAVCGLVELCSDNMKSFLMLKMGFGIGCDADKKRLVEMKGIER